MAGKARRAAARQGQLNRKRKKSQRGPSGIPTAAVVDNEAAIDNAAESAADSAAASGAVADQENGVASVEAVASPTPVPARANRPATAPRTATAGRSSRPDAVPQGPGRIRGERPAAYNYMGAELRRIGVLSVSVIAVLVVLGIVL